MPEKEAAETLYSAILAVQGEVRTLYKDKQAVVKTKTGGEYKYRYVSLDTVVEHVGPVLNKHGLIWQTFPTVDDAGHPALRYKLTHAPTGESEGDMMRLQVGDGSPQAMGSALTYARRYAICSVLNIVSDEDDDARQAQESAGTLARAKANMTAKAKGLMVDADEIFNQDGPAMGMDADGHKRYLDSTGYTEEGLQRYVAWLKANQLKEKKDA